MVNRQKVKVENNNNLRNNYLFEIKALEWKLGQADSLKEFKIIDELKTNTNFTSAEPPAYVGNQAWTTNH